MPTCGLPARWVLWLVEAHRLRHRARKSERRPSRVPDDSIDREAAVGLERPDRILSTGTEATIDGTGVQALIDERLLHPHHCVALRAIGDRHCRSPPPRPRAEFR